LCGKGLAPCDSIPAMSSHYESLFPLDLYPDAFGVPVPTVEVGRDVWPRKPAVFIRQVRSIEPAMPGAEPAPEVSAADADADAASEAVSGEPAAPALTKAVQRELVVGQFGFVPRWVKSASDAKLRSTKLVTTRSETVSTSNISREAWLAGQRCIVPIQAFFEDDLRTGKPLPTRIARVDGKAMGVAGLWEQWEKDGDTITSFTLLTINANSHALMRRYGHPGTEKRMLAVLSEGTYDAWLSARPEKAREFMRAYPANWLLANPVETKKPKVPAVVRGL
jgi:putative SOS response-associated peptidase YedK